MAFEEALVCQTYPSAADLSGSQYCFVAIDSAGRVALATEGGRAIGVLQNKPGAIDREARVAVAGTTRVKCGGTIAAGAVVSVGSGGKANSVGSGDDQQMGVMSEGAVNDQIGSMLIDKRGLS